MINNIEYGASTIIPVPSPITGIIIIGATSITYYNSNGNQQSVEISPAMVLSYTSICDDGSRYLFGDHRGLLSVLALRIDSSYGSGIVGSNNINNNSSSDAVLGSNVVTSIVVDTIGMTSIATSLAYLSYGILYIGSQYGDNQLIKLYPEKKNIDDDDDNNDYCVDSDNSKVNGDNGGYNKSSKYNDTSCSSSGSGRNSSMFEVISTYTNIGPILDMSLVDNDKQGGQRQLVTCSGAFKDGSLRVIRSGVGIHEQAMLDVSGIKGVWSLHGCHSDDESGNSDTNGNFGSSTGIDIEDSGVNGSIYDKYLVQSFIGETRILSINKEEMEEVSFDDLVLY